MSTAKSDKTITVYLSEAKTRLSELIDLALIGTKILITRNGRPQAALVSMFEEANKNRCNTNGFMKEELKDWEAPDDFDTMMQDEIIEMFEGENTNLINT